jgi:hypothetical protein
MIEKTIEPEGRFERHGKSLSKTQKKKKPTRAAGIKKGEIISKPNQGRGRPKGSLNKVTLALKEAILAAAEGAHEDGMVGYLKVLAVENSSAFAGLLGKVLPSTLAVSDSDGGKERSVTFQRIIVWPDGRREIEGVTPKALPAPDASQTD